MDASVYSGEENGMAMNAGSNDGLRSEINMTPLIDVLLVLLIIFMVITPLTSRGLDALVPSAPSDRREAQPPTDDVVISVGPNRAIQLNQEPLDLAALEQRLRGLFKNRESQHPVFVRGDKGLEFQEVAQVIDLARGAGAARIALMTN